jgi:hypothetical protein
MKFTSIIVTFTFGILTINVNAFTIPTRLAPTRRTTLNMVADDAKVILVTGSSRGLGKSIALDLGAHQQKVVVNYVSEGSKASAEATVEEIKALGGDAIAVQADSKLLFEQCCIYNYLLVSLTVRSNDIYKPCYLTLFEL